MNTPLRRSGTIRTKRLRKKAVSRPYVPVGMHGGIRREEDGEEQEGDDARSVKQFIGAYTAYTGQLTANTEPGMTDD